MNPVEIEEAVSELAEAPFDAAEFAFQFLEAFGNKKITLDRLREDPSKKSSQNKSDLGGVCQRSNIHIKVCAPGAVSATLKALRDSKATSTAKVKFILATDGEMLEAEEVGGVEAVACEFARLADHFGFFLPLAGISTVKEIRESAIDIKATARLNKLYLQLIKDNPGWEGEARRHDLNHFMARLIFCFFAEDTDIFHGDNAFTTTIETFARGDVTVEFVMGEVFRAMNIPIQERDAANLPNWANHFPYVNGGLFSGSPEVPTFSKIAKAYLLRIGALNWQLINPDIFGSMIQAVADAQERSALGMHYTSVPSILKVLNPLFLDDLPAKLEAADRNPQRLRSLRTRMSKIRVFDPACGSGNFLVIAYKQMRGIEAEINKRLGEPEQRTLIPATNFRGIEIRDFSAEIARLALIIAEYQCDVVHRGQKMALLEFLPLNEKNWIAKGNALKLEWLDICPPTGTGVKLTGDDLFETPLEQPEIDFENEGGETYICGNLPYLGSTWQDAGQKEDMRRIFDGRVKNWKSLDYVAGWFMKAADYAQVTPTVAAFVSTNSICQGQQVPILWPKIFGLGMEIRFAHSSFKWANLASHNAGVTVVIVAIGDKTAGEKALFELGERGETVQKLVGNINAYLVPGANVIVEKASKPLTGVAEMDFGNKPVDGGHLLLTKEGAAALNLTLEQEAKFIRRIYGSVEFIRGLSRYCLWIEDQHLDEALAIPAVAQRIEGVRAMRLASRDKGANAMAERAHQMREMNIGNKDVLVLPCVSSENRQFLPVGYAGSNSTITNLCFGLFDAPLWNLALLASRTHLIWIATVCGQLETRLRYSNTLGWNTFPVPDLTEKNKADLTRCAENILLAREAHFPATIADLYDPKTMPQNLADAHEANDETLERIYIGRRFKNDTERLEHLFNRYTQMTTKVKGEQCPVEWCKSGEAVSAS